MTSLTESLLGVKTRLKVIRKHTLTGSLISQQVESSLEELDTIITTLEQPTNDVERVREAFEAWMHEFRLIHFGSNPTHFEAWQAALTQKLRFKP